ncbi:MAG: MBOAT family protein [Spiribacter salinus]|uniref:Probable alginate O-acetylase n=1 Tax=Spiribacter salinus TaxID=1335746 RepID=A0A540VTN9_9GAMM|nr:MAG: MBOAT family protein [Spiribacter salinus]
MLFNSVEFLFVFLPITVIGYFLIRPRAPRLSLLWLVAASLVFYAWFEWRYALLLIGSVAFNFFVGRWLARVAAQAEGDWGQARRAKPVLVLAVGVNLAVLGYFKYAVFVLENMNALLGTEWTLARVVLPLAISFFTFQQITYLVDAYRGLTREYDPLSFFVFVTFFPQLIAGPIVHHREMMPQFRQVAAPQAWVENLAVGLSIFVLGLFKKVVLADGIAVHASPMFNAAAAGASPTLLEAWPGVLAYSLQLYFDFSGYSDMAVGLARIFGIRLPANFFSPYKARNIIDFWRRWHMTLSRFLRDYVYVPLGGNRRGRRRRYVNLVATMLIGGVWHGAGWTFVLWGALHGLYLLVNHLLAELNARFRQGRPLLPALVAVPVTFLFVVLAWVPFRAADIGTAGRIYAGMLGLNGVVLPSGYAGYLGGWQARLQALGVEFSGDPGTYGGATQLAWVLALMAIAWFTPNTLQWFRRYRPVLRDRDLMRGTVESAPCWRPTMPHAAAVAVLALLAVASLTKATEFLYFQF